MDVVSDVVQDVVPHLNGIPSKQLKPRVRFGGAANYEPRITEYIAENCGFIFVSSFGDNNGQ